MNVTTRFLAPVLTAGAVGAGALIGGALTAPAAGAQPVTDDNPTQCQNSGPSGTVERCDRSGHTRIFVEPGQRSEPFFGAPFGDGD